MNVRDIELGARNLWTGAMFIGSVLLPVSALLALFFTIKAWREDAGPWLRSYALIVSAGDAAAHRSTCGRGACSASGRGAF